MPTLDVPHFYSGLKPGQAVSDDIQSVFNIWMAQRDLYYAEFAFKLDWSDLLWTMGMRYQHLTHVITGYHWDGYVHTVLGRNGMVIHDPATDIVNAKLTTMRPLPDRHYRVGIIAKNL